MFNKGGARGQHSLYPNTPSNIEFMEAKKTVWSIFRDYVNSKPIGTEITRQEILNQVEKELVEIGKTINHYQKGIVANFSSTTLDCARNMATGRYYLEKTEKVGHYKIICHFPSYYTISQLRKDYDREQKMMSERNGHGSRNNSNED